MRISPGPRAAGSRAEFELFVADSAEPLLRTAYLVVWDLAEAEDLVQACLLAVARRWPRVRRMDHPRAYARRILLNLALAGLPPRQRAVLVLRYFDDLSESQVADALGCSVGT